MISVNLHYLIHVKFKVISYQQVFLQGEGLAVTKKYSAFAAEKLLNFDV